MAKNLKGVSLNNLTASQKKQMGKHKVHHSKAHLKRMATAMRKGKSFKQSHNIAMKAVGK
tara:strand:- start:415 stop:594 length:180 start_codon:yes stop_codon:yes gene_type:complete